MVLPNLYSRRKRNAEKVGDDIYQYEECSDKLKNQILFVFEAWNSKYDVYDNRDPIYGVCVTIMRKELGRQSLSERFAPNVKDEFNMWFRASESIDDLMDSIEVAVRVAEHCGQRGGSSSLDAFEGGLAEINARMLEAGLGFQIDDGQVIQLSSTFVHQQVTLPAFGLISGIEFKVPNDEFRQAYEEFNQGNFDDCIHDCCNAFESVLKVILTQKGWTFDANKDTAKKLLWIAFENELIPSYMQTEFTGLRTILESGVPTVRNKTGGHGAGAFPRNIPKHIAAFQLHQTAAAIVLLVEASKNQIFCAKDESLGSTLTPKHTTPARPPSRD
jgi:AbiJ N-terminal domain 4